MVACGGFGGVVYSLHTRDSRVSLENAISCSLPSFYLTDDSVHVAGYLFLLIVHGLEDSPPWLERYASEKRKTMHALRSAGMVNKSTRRIGDCFRGSNRKLLASFSRISLLVHEEATFPFAKNDEKSIISLSLSLYYNISLCITMYHVPPFAAR